MRSRMVAAEVRRRILARKPVPPRYLGGYGSCDESGTHSGLRSLSSFYSSMKNNGHKSASPSGRLAKCPTGIQGLDEITGGGLPRGRPTLVCGGAGCGKTLLAAEFLARGAMQFGEPGVFMSFEETGAELKANVASLGFDLASLVRRKKILLEHVHRSEERRVGKEC